MHNSVSSEMNVLVSCFMLGLVSALIFDVFKAWRIGKFVKPGQLIVQDILYFVIISFVVFYFILKINGAEIRGYMICSAVVSFVLYRILLSKYIIRVFIWIKKLIKYAVKIALMPIVAIGKIAILPILKIKQKLLSKKAKIALTIKRFCFKIKCNVGFLWLGNIFCKERKPCRRKRKPEKRV